ncbi:MAG: transporter, ATP-binding protein [Acidimicrobiales bacterium]|nr:transporter, ATP-binding protein [Acidimicrobiales bacterium]
MSDRSEATATSRSPNASNRFAWRILRADPRTYAISLTSWIIFFALPLPAGLLARAVLDRVGSDGPGPTALSLLIALAAVELTRWTVLALAIVQWHGAWVFWHTVPRVNILRSLVHDPGPVTDRLPGSAGEAVSRFRDDTRDVAQVLDVWLDLVAAFVTSASAFVVLLTIDARAALAVVAPVLVVLWIGHQLAHRLRAWRWTERQRTAAVTGFLGDTFGGITAVKVAGAEAAVLRRFARLGEARAQAARRDQVGTQLVQTLSGITANLGLGLALLFIAPLVRRGGISVGDIALFAGYSTVMASLPRITGRYATWHRQADVSVERLGRLLPERTPARAAARVTTYLRGGPPPLDPQRHPAPARRSGPDRLDHLAIRGLSVRLDAAAVLDGIDLDVRRGQLVVVTGPVGSGKSLLLRSLLGLVPRAGGEVRWNDEVVIDPSVFLVPPRTAYVPQVPRLFSEPLADTVLLGADGTGLADALRLACLDDDLNEMPAGVATMVGPKGVRLSGGQIQRTAAARAFIRRPELLVVDDLSSALDTATEARVWDGVFAAAAGDLTVLAVSHRPRILERADQVIELTAGRRRS